MANKMNFANKNRKEFQLKNLPSWLRAMLLALFAVSLITLGAEATTVSKTNNTAGFADDNTLTRTVIFTEDIDFVANSVIQDVNIAINFEKIDGTCPTHGGGNAYNGEIFMYLESPTGTQVALVEDAWNSAGSGTGTTYPGIAYGGLAAVTFDDWAATTVGGLVPTSGTFRPVEPLSAFQGETPLGTWTLYAGDSVLGDPLCFYEFTLTIDATQPPTVNNQTFSVVEQSADGTSVGTIVATDNDAGDKLTYVISSGNSAGIFAINKLTGEITVAVGGGSQLDYETTTSYDLDVQVTDSSGLTDTATITINVTNANEAPTDIALDNSSVVEHRPIGTVVGNFSTTDPDVGDSHTYSLVSGTGDTDNALFTISGGQLQTAVEFDYDIPPLTYSIRVQTDDGDGGTFAKQFTITIEDGNDPPSDIALDNASVAENQVVGTAVGNFSSTDNSGDTHTYTLVDGDGADDNALFQIPISGVQLQTKTVFNYEGKSSYTIRVRSTDDGTGNLWFEESFTITITDGNDAPTDIALDNSSVAENQSPGTAVGSFSTTDPDVGDSHTYVLTDTVNYPDNASFTISSGGELQTAVSFNFEAQSSYSIRVQTDDENGGVFNKVFTITITDANDAPTDITLNISTVDEHQPVGTLVGNFSTTDPDTGDSHTYSLATGTGDTDNALFSISGGQLQTAIEFDYDIPPLTYSIRVQTDDGNGGTFSKQFAISITDGNDPPSDIALDNASVAENQPSGTAVGSFSTTDSNGGTHIYSLVDGTGSTGNTSFQIVNGNELQTQVGLDSETNPTYSIRVRSTDNGGLWFEEVFTITITDENDAPTDISLDSSSVAENQIVGTLVGNFSSTDQDSGDSHTYVLTDTVNYPDNMSFTIGGVSSDQLQSAVMFDRETKSSYSIRVQTDDGNGGTFEKTLTITITNENDDPTDITLDSSSVAENESIGTAVGNLSTTDPDSGDSFTYSLVAGNGSTDNASFQINSGQLQTADMFDFEAQPTYSIRIRTRDSGGSIFEKEFTITVSDANDAPVAVDDSETTDEDHLLTVPADGVLANDTDQDSGDTLTVMSFDSPSTQGASVNVAGDGGFSYDPTAAAALQALNVGEVLADTFDYVVSDGSLFFISATVSVTVTGVNDAPVAIDDTVMTMVETAVIISPLSNDTDPDTTDTKSIASFNQGTHGAVTDNGNGTLTYTPATGYVGNDSFTYSIEDSHSASDTATVNVTVSPEIYTVYLPAALNNYTTAPDLVITNVQASSGYVEIVIENQGNQATESGFWVDFYVDPNPAPQAANELWPNVSAEGLAWGVTTPILPSQSLTLIYSTAPNAPNLYYSAAESLFSGTLPAGTPIYAQVDSAHVGHPNGAVEENHEIMGGVYNNIFQDVATAVPTTNSLTNDPASAASSVFLPTRH